jgi:hypothetical protein
MSVLKPCRACERYTQRLEAVIRQCDNHDNPYAALANIRHIAAGLTDCPLIEKGEPHVPTEPVPKDDPAPSGE